MAHMAKTGHTAYKWDISKDYQAFQLKYGRPPEENDEYMANYKCAACGEVFG